jgi:hypothetical protein
MPIRKRLPKSAGYKLKEQIKVDEHGREYFVHAGGLPDVPLGELATDAARAQAWAEAAKPRRIYIRKWQNEEPL